MAKLSARAGRAESSPSRSPVRAFAAALLVSGCSVVGIRSGTEEPTYTVVATVQDVEIRRYAPRIAIETRIPADEQTARYDGFRRLAGYIFGGNRTGTKLAMTAPVAQRRDGTGEWTIQFFAPAAYRLPAMPVPDDPAVRITPIPGETYAVRRFSGSRSPEAIAGQTRILLARLRGSSWKTTAVPVAWFYDPPWTLPLFRRNEVAVTVEALVP